MIRELLASEDYAQEGGIRCPYCLSENIEGREINIDAGYMAQECGCLDCNKSWYDEYKLTGYEAKE